MIRDGSFAALLVTLGGFASAVVAQPWKDDAISLTYKSGTSVKVEQIIGDCDWAIYDPTSVCKPTTSKTATKYDVLGTDLGYSFEHKGKVIFLFGDTVGRVKQFYPRYISSIDPFDYDAHDPMAYSSTSRPEDGLLINFFTNPDGSTLLVEPQYTDGTYLPMTGDDTPGSGISIDGQIYMVCNSGADPSNKTDPHANAYSVLSRFDEATNKFHAGRTVSQTAAGGHFVFTALHEFPPELGSFAPDWDEPTILMYGEGQYRASDIYLAVIPKSDFESGKRTRYFAGFKEGRPTWTDVETAAAPVVVDNPLNTSPYSPTVGNMSVIYSSELRLWLMTYDGGRQTPATAGVYFAYAPNPWGPWSTPQLIFNSKTDHGFGTFIYNQNFTPPGPAGPTFNLANDPPDTTIGGVYAPFMIERFTELRADTLTISYAMSTWNPYTVVRMRSDFAIAGLDRRMIFPGLTGGPNRYGFDPHD